MTVFKVSSGNSWMGRDHPQQPEQRKTSCLFQRTIRVAHTLRKVAFEASPFTTIIELEVGSELCSMLGYPTDTKSTIQPWGHVACDGTIANMESMWYVHARWCHIRTTADLTPFVQGW